MSVTAAWLIGSVEDMPEYDLSITGGGGGATSIATGDYYLYDAVTARSLVDQLEAAMDGESITGASVFITAGGCVRIEASISFTITWTDTALRDLLGFTATVGPTTGATASNKSPLFWSPAWQETPEAPQGVQGVPVRDVQVSSSASGLTMRHRVRTTRTRNRFQWRNVAIDRAWTTAEAGGEYRRFYDDVVKVGQRFKLYGGVTETTGSSTVFSSSYILGPYKQGKPTPGWWRRVDPSRDQLSNVDLKVNLVSEYA